MKCYNFHESLSGIETTTAEETIKAGLVTISTNPYQGLKHRQQLMEIEMKIGYNFHESLSGIETDFFSVDV